MTLRSGEVYFSEQNSSFVIPESISLFGFSISFYGVFLVFAALIGIMVITNETRKKHQNVEWNLTLITIAVISALAGARIYYMMFQWKAFIEEPIALLNFRSGGLSYFGALFGVWGTLKWYCRKRDEAFAPGADSLCFGAAAAAPFVWLGCAFIREPLGRFYDGLFAVKIGTEYVVGKADVLYSEELLGNVRTINETMYLSMHPVAVYGIVLSIAVFVVLCIYKRKTKQEGALFSMYLFLNAVACLVLEYFRAERCCIWGTEIPVNYIVSGVIILMIVIGWMKQLISSRKLKKNTFITG